jgi:hypothetical protein
MNRRTSSATVFAVVGVFLISFVVTNASDLPVVVEDSGAKQVDLLVAQLVSTRSAPYPTGYGEDPAPSGEYVLGGGSYITPQVETAMQKLAKEGPAIFPWLIKHMQDDRYSYSYWCNSWINASVGDAIIDLLSDGHSMYGGSLKSPTFHDYIYSKDREKWAEWAKNKTQLEIQMDFIDWCIAQEEKTSLTAEQRKRIVARYEDARLRVRKEYSEKGNSNK